jgi:hypothetical protein
MKGPRPRPRRPKDLAIVVAFRSALVAAPVAVSIAFGLQLAVAVSAVAFAAKILTSAVVIVAVASIVTLVVAIGARDDRAYRASVLTLAVTCALADLPIHRSDAIAFAAVAGAVVLAFAEAGGAALEPKGGGKHVGRPAGLHAVWVAVVAAGGGVAGWLLLSLQSDLSGLGLAALGVGVLAAVCMVGLAAVLTTAAISERRRG